MRIMEITASPHSEHSDGQRVATEAASAQAQPQPDRSLLGALRKGAEDARTAAEKAIPKVKSAAANAVYWTTYEASSAAVFQWELAKLTSGSVTHQHSAMNFAS